MSGPCLNLLTIRSIDIDRSAQFYASLGLSFSRHRHGAGPIHYSAESEGLVFEIHPLREGDSSTRSARLGFRIRDLEAALHNLLTAGATLIARPTPSPWGERAIVEDPDGHKIELLAQQASPDSIEDVPA